MKYRDLFKGYHQKYVAQFDDQWYLITETSLVILNSPVSESSLVLELSEIINSWTKSQNYKLLTVQALMRQLDRLPSGAVLIQDNLVAIKYNEEKKIFWAKIADSIDVPRILVLEKFGENPTNAEFLRRNIIEKIKANINRNWGDKTLNIFAQKILIEPTQGESDMVTALAKSKYTSDLVLGERNLFDTAYFQKLMSVELAKITDNVRVK